jgi:hypothetical protein
MRIFIATTLVWSLFAAGATFAQCPSNKYQLESLSGIGFNNSAELFYHAGLPAGSAQPPVDNSIVSYSTIRYFILNRMAIGFTSAETIEQGNITNASAGVVLDQTSNKVTAWDFDLEIYYVYGFLKYFEAYTSISAGPEIAQRTMSYNYPFYPANNSSVTTSYSVMAWHYSPIGIRVGGRIAGFLEFGLGYRGVISGGLSYKFGAPCWWRN